MLDKTRADFQGSSVQTIEDLQVSFYCHCAGGSELMKGKTFLLNLNE